MTIELNEKIGTLHREIYQRMLGIHELPDFLLREYFSVKRLIDKVDGTLSPFDLVQIAIRAGFDVETMTFNPPPTAKMFVMATEPPIAPEMQEKIDALDEKPPTMPQVESEPANAPVDVDDPIEQVANPTPEPITRLELDQQVEIFLNDEIVKGIIVGLPKKGSDIYKVKVDHEIHEVPEIEIDN